MDENMAADVLTGTDASAESADFDGLFDMDGGEVTAEPQETEGQEGAAQAQEPEADPAEGTCADAQPGRQEQPGAEPKYKVKFYGQEQEMTVSELVAAAQKGLDYDNVRTRLEQAQQSAPAVQLVERYAAANGMTVEQYLQFANVPFPVSWTVKMKKKQKETQDILSYHTQAAGCSDKARAKASGGRQPIEECGRTGL